jgi:DNA replication and repair protein RecF
MYLQKLQLNQFKNCETAELLFSDKINCFVGNNGEGKTNILDAIYYLSFCKSYFNAIDQQNIMHGTDYFTISGIYLRNLNQPDLVSCVQKKNTKKSFRFNKKEYDRLADHIGKFPLVMISPYDRDLINEGSDVRRKFIDGVISQFDPIYLDELIIYNKALLQRNTLLKQFAENRYFDAMLLGVWDDQLVRSGTVIFEKRKAFLALFAPLFVHYYSIVTRNCEAVEIQYESALHENSLDQLLHQNIEIDCNARYTTSGIHKDDLLFLIKNFPLKRFGSQGQQKSFVIAIKLAQFDFTQKVMGYKPILLFDDIFDKLDDNRVAQLIELVGNDNFGQVFITDTQLQRIELLFNNSTIQHKIFEVVSGHISENISES